MNKNIYYSFVVLYLSILIIPIYWIFRAAFSSQSFITAIPLNFSIEFELENFYKLYSQTPLIRYLLNSLFYSVSTALITVIASFAAAYGFSRFEFKYRIFLMWTVLVTIALPEISTLIPLYKILQSFNLLNSVLGLCIITSSLLTPFTIWIFVPFINKIPKEIEEAGFIDGANILNMLIKIIVPISFPILSAMFLINFINTWNNLIFPLAFCATDECKTLSVAITEIYSGRTPYGRPWDLISALAMIIIAPLIAIIFFTNRTIIGGLTSGSIK